MGGAGSNPGAFAAAVTATAKVFLMGVAGFWLIRRGIIASQTLGALGAMIANLTLPALIFHRFAVQFDPDQMPYWWALVLAGGALQCFTLGIGFLASRRYSEEGGRHEFTMLVGYHNAGFFVLPMLQALLPASEFDRAAVLLFVFIIFFNASVWPAGTRILLRQKGFDVRRLLLLPPTLWTLIALAIFGLARPWVEPLRGTPVWSALIGGESPGAIQLLGDLTVPLATIVLGGTIAQTARAGWSGFTNRRAAFEVAFWKLLFVPLIGFLIIRWWPGTLFDDRTLRLLIMLQFAAPPAMNVAVFCQQYGVPMRLTPAASLLAYLLCVLSVPFWVALVL